MSMIIIPRKHLRQPQGRIALKDEWADAQFVTAAQAISNAPHVVSGGSRGLSFNINYASGGRSARPAQGSALPCAETGATLVVIASLAAGAPNSYLYALVTGFPIDLRADSINLMTTGQAGLYNTTFPKALTSRVYCKAPKNFVGAPLDMYTSGVRQTLTPSQSPTGLLVTAPMVVGNVHTLTRQWAGDITLAVGIPQCVLPEIAEDISRNPWQLFRADPIRTYSLPTGAISINSITASNITQTGARITLGLTR